MLGRKGSLAGNGVDTTVGQGRRHVSQVAAADQHRALAEVVLQAGHGVAVDDAEVLQHPGDGAVAVAGLALGTVHRLVHSDVVADEVGQGRFDPLPLLRRCVARHQAGGCDCTSIDHRVERCTSLGIETDGVEGVAAGLHAHLAGDEVLAPVRQGGGVDEGLGDGLDGEGLVRVAHLVGHPVHGDDADAEPGRVGLGQLGDIAGDLAAIQGGELVVQGLQIGLDRRLHGLPRALRC